MPSRCRRKCGKARSPIFPIRCFIDAPGAADTEGDAENASSPAAAESEQSEEPGTRRAETGATSPPWPPQREPADGRRGSERRAPRWARRTRRWPKRMRVRRIPSRLVDRGRRGRARRRPPAPASPPSRLRSPPQAGGRPPRPRRARGRTPRRHEAGKPDRGARLWCRWTEGSDAEAEAEEWDGGDGGRSGRAWRGGR